MNNCHNTLEELVHCLRHVELSLVNHFYIDSSVGAVGFRQIKRYNSQKNKGSIVEEEDLISDFCHCLTVAFSLLAIHYHTSVRALTDHSHGI